MIIVVLVVGVASRHVVGRERRQVAPRGVVRVVRMVPGLPRVVVVVVVVAQRGEVQRLELVSSLGEHVDIHALAVGAAGIAAIRAQARRRAVGRVGVRRRDVGRAKSRGRGAADGLGHRRGRSHEAVAVVGLNVRRRHLALVGSPAIGVVVYPRVAGQLVGARELLAAARELASMGLLSGVSPDVPGLVLEAMEGLVAERALVGPGELIGRLLGRLARRQRAVGPDVGNGSGSHLDVLLLSRGFGWFRCSSRGGRRGVDDFLVGSRISFWVE